MPVIHVRIQYTIAYMLSLREDSSNVQAQFSQVGTNWSASCIGFCSTDQRFPRRPGQVPRVSVGKPIGTAATQDRHPSKRPLITNVKALQQKMLNEANTSTARHFHRYLDATILTRRSNRKQPTCSQFVLHFIVIFTWMTIMSTGNIFHNTWNTQRQSSRTF